jgi:hypothetical protein
MTLRQRTCGQRWPAPPYHRGQCLLTEVERPHLEVDCHSGSAIGPMSGISALRQFKALAKTEMQAEKI